MDTSPLELMELGRILWTTSKAKYRACKVTNQTCSPQGVKWIARYILALRVAMRAYGPSLS